MEREPGRDPQAHTPTNPPPQGEPHKHEESAYAAPATTPPQETEEAPESLPTPGLDLEDKLMRGEYAAGEGHGQHAPGPTGAAAAPADYRSEMALSQRQVIGLSGAFLLLLGVFLPVVSLPVIGTLSLFSANTIAGVILLGLGGYGFFAAVRNDFRFLQWAGALALAVLLVAFINLLQGPGAVGVEEGDPLGLAEILEQGTNYMWGWAVLLTGGALLFLSGRVRDEFQIKRRVTTRS